MSSQDLRPSSMADYRPGVLEPFITRLNFAGTATGPFNAGNADKSVALPSFERNVTVHTAADTIKVARLQANSAYLVFMRLITAQGATCTIAAATNESSAQTLVSAFDLNGTPGAMVGLNKSSAGVAAVINIGTADCDLVLTLGHTTDAAVVDVMVMPVVATPRLPAAPAA